jgi:ferredoxin
MSAVIYYFSGTGNSLAVARDISERLDARLISISSVIDRVTITPEADIVGIVFPVYYVGLSNLPLIVKRFVMKLENIDEKYIFAVCTYGGGSGPTLKILGELIASRGGRLAAGFGVQMPQNAFDKPFENREKLCRNWKNIKLAAICEYIDAKKSGHFDPDSRIARPVIRVLMYMENLSFLRPFFIRSIYRAAGHQNSLDIPFAEAMPLVDNSYHSDGNCTGCGTCVKVCPVQNIKMAEGRPEWLHHCENCLACINWCPKKAIHGYAELPNLRRYHHPDVKISDMMGQPMEKT